jgi:hypothetical protein|tara:strand:+ start:333 stop:440 length:108 start_codon:yes stop_codon:yes gene_type:complete
MLKYNVEVVNGKVKSKVELKGSTAKKKPVKKKTAK